MKVMYTKNNRFDIPLLISNVILFSLTATVTFLYLFSGTEGSFGHLLFLYTLLFSVYRIPITLILAAFVLIFWWIVKSDPCNTMSKRSKWINLSLTVFSVAAILGEISFGLILRLR